MDAVLIKITTFGCMKRFKSISAIFISVIALIFACNVFYLARLYCSIREGVERDVVNALADADIDELWLRAEMARNSTINASMMVGNSEEDPYRKGEMAAYKDSEGNFITTTRYADGTVEEKAGPLMSDQSYTNQMIEAIRQQFHAIMDPYVDFDSESMDSILIRRLADRMIYPEFVAVEVVDSIGSVVSANPLVSGDMGAYDVFILPFNPVAGLSYRVYITSLTRHILSEMTGVIVTTFLLMVAFAAAFLYLFNTVSRLRTLEEMKDEFTNNMTHELKTPIAIAYSANDALLNYDTANDPVKKDAYLKISLKQLRRLGELVEGILAMSMERRRGISLHPERVMVRDFVGEIAASHRMRGDKDIRITVECDDPEMCIETDRTHFGNIINNLVDNAIKYSGDSVSIRISCDATGITVSDNGLGIPAKSLPYIFNKFYRVPHGDRQDVRGYGIGLYYVKNIIDRMGWSISASSRAGHGSVFAIKFGSDERQDIVG